MASQTVQKNSLLECLRYKRNINGMINYCCLRHSQGNGGYAKLWCNNQADVFCNLNEFAVKLQLDFPINIVEADIHIKLLQKTRKPNESVSEYFYEMCGIGRKGKLSDLSIIKYIRNVLN